MWMRSPDSAPLTGHLFGLSEWLGAAATQEQLISMDPSHPVIVPSLGTPLWRVLVALMPDRRLQDGWLVVGDLGSLQEKTRQLLAAHPGETDVVELLGKIGIRSHSAKAWLEALPKEPGPQRPAPGAHEASAPAPPPPRPGACPRCPAVPRGRTATPPAAASRCRRSATRSTRRPRSPRCPRSPATLPARAARPAAPAAEPGLGPAPLAAHRDHRRAPARRPGPGAGGVRRPARHAPGHAAVGDRPRRQRGRASSGATSRCSTRSSRCSCGSARGPATRSTSRSTATASTPSSPPRSAAEPVRPGPHAGRTATGGHG